MSLALAYNDDSHALDTTNQSILYQGTSLKNKTILDYRDFLNQSLDRAGSLVIHEESFVNESGLNELSKQDIDELGRHAHSDLDSDCVACLLFVTSALILMK